MSMLALLRHSLVRRYVRSCWGKLT